MVYISNECRRKSNTIGIESRGSDMKVTKRRVSLAPFEVIEILNDVSRTVATSHDFYLIE